LSELTGPCIDAAEVSRFSRLDVSRPCRRDRQVGIDGSRRNCSSSPVTPPEAKVGRPSCPVRRRRRARRSPRLSEPSGWHARARSESPRFAGVGCARDRPSRARRRCRVATEKRAGTSRGEADPDCRCRRRCRGGERDPARGLDRSRTSIPEHPPCQGADVAVRAKARRQRPFISSSPGRAAGWSAWRSWTRLVLRAVAQRDGEPGSL